jgi:hypothetical protein
VLWSEAEPKESDKDGNEGNGVLHGHGGHSIVYMGDYKTAMHNYFLTWRALQYFFHRLCSYEVAVPAVFFLTVPNSVPNSLSASSTKSVDAHAHVHTPCCIF